MEKGLGPLTSQIRIRSCLQRPKTISDHEDSSTEPSEGFVQQTRPCYQSADPVEKQSPDEDGFVAIMSEDPVRMAKRCQWIGTYSARQLYSNSRANQVCWRTEVCRL